MQVNILCTRVPILMAARSRSMAFSEVSRTVHTALQGKQRGRCFPKAGKTKEKDFSPQFLQHFIMRNASLPMNKMLDSRGIRVVLSEELLVLQSL